VQLELSTAAPVMTWERVHGADEVPFAGGGGLTASLEPPAATCFFDLPKCGLDGLAAQLVESACPCSVASSICSFADRGLRMRLPSCWWASSMPRSLRGVVGRREQSGAGRVGCGQVGVGAVSGGGQQYADGFVDPGRGQHIGGCDAGRRGARPEEPCRLLVCSSGRQANTPSCTATSTVPRSSTARDIPRASSSDGSRGDWACTARPVAGSTTSRSTGGRAGEDWTAASRPLGRKAMKNSPGSS